MKKCDFFCKNLLTNAKVGAIISKVAQKVTILQKNSKKYQKSEKTFKKGIDKWVLMWYNIKVAARVATSVIEN
ncbi:MAG: hypothetical protein IKV02_03750 [Clostridia bacterium]|nr:hypothetical protein [Clostridia bacterium]